MAEPEAGNLIACSARELREVRDYVRKLEVDQHSLRIRNGRLSQARSIRLARTIGELRRSPVSTAVRMIRILFEGSSSKTPTHPALRHRGFAVLERRALPEVAAIAGAAHLTVIAEIAERTAPKLFVGLRGAEPATRPTSDAEWCSVGPHDYEFLLLASTNPVLLIDPLAVPRTSPWYGVFDVQDMRLNLAMAGLILTVRDRGGRIVFVRTPAELATPLLADFTEGVEVVSSIDQAFDRAEGL